MSPRPATWEPVKPSLSVATESYQVLLELNRQHPGDLDLENALEDARYLMHHVWAERQARRANAR